MLMAFLKGKLSSKQANMEDILTSNVFGTLQYLAPSKALLPFLSQAIDSNELYLLRDLGEVSDVKYDFWPQFNEADCVGCEPDVVLRITKANGSTTMILVEAKYLSGKSSEADENARPNDQLAREWDNLRLKAEKEKATPILLYLTAGLSFPAAEINQSQAELKRDRNIEGTICWLSWQHLHSIIKESKEPMLMDLAGLLKKMQLTLFDGFSPVTQVEHINWFFDKYFNWKISNILTLTWSFDK